MKFQKYIISLVIEVCIICDNGSVKNARYDLKSIFTCLWSNCSKRLVLVYSDNFWKQSFVSFASVFVSWDKACLIKKQSIPYTNFEHLISKIKYRNWYFIIFTQKPFSWCSLYFSNFEILTFSFHFPCLLIRHF